MVATVETQLALDAPPAVRRTLERLCAARISRPEALRAIAAELAKLMWALAQGERPGEDPNELYSQELERIDAREWGGDRS